MAASLKGTSGLVFGVTAVTGVIMQSFKMKIATDLAEARDEDGDRVAFAFYGGNRTDTDGNYLFKGAHIVSGAIATAISAITSLGGGDTYLLSYGVEERHDGFKMGDFTAVAASGITG
jgi:hypothetical protein